MTRAEGAALGVERLQHRHHLRPKLYKTPSRASPSLLHGLRPKADNARTTTAVPKAARGARARGAGRGGSSGDLALGAKDGDGEHALHGRERGAGREGRGARGCGACEIEPRGRVLFPRVLRQLLAAPRRERPGAARRNALRRRGGVL